jgi:hypothetical protein
LKNKNDVIGFDFIILSVVGNFIRFLIPFNIKIPAIPNNTDIGYGKVNAVIEPILINTHNHFR